MSRIGVLIPTRNAMVFLPGHLDTMRAWLDLAEEVVVVDSGSADGSAEFLVREIPGARVVQNAPGLYQSWNAGLAQMRSRFTYISTVGDGISRAGLLHLRDVAEKFAADAVISPPQFVNEAGAPAANNDWPVHDLIQTLGITEEVCLEGLPLFLVAMTYIPFAILGSSASNLYRTETLQRHPFPTEYGRNGDGAWGFIHALGLRLALTPRRDTFFRLHRPTHRRSEYYAPNGDQRMFDAALGELRLRMKENPRLREEAVELGVEPMVGAKEEALRWRGLLQGYRLKGMPWIFNAWAWQARWNRESWQRKCREMLHRLMRDRQRNLVRTGTAGLNPAAV